MANLSLEDLKQFEIPRDLKRIKDILPAEKKLKLSSHDFCPTWNEEDICKLQEGSSGLSREILEKFAQIGAIEKQNLESLVCQKC